MKRNNVLQSSDFFAELVGEKVRALFALIRRLFHFQKEVLKSVPLIFKNFHLTLDQMYVVGISSIPLVASTSIFTGAVSSYQMAYQFADIVPEMYIGTAVGKSVLVELGPVLTAMVMAGRIGAAMCAELGTMAVTEQLDAMKSLNIKPHRYLLAPRLVASVVMMPILTIISSFVAILGAYVVAWAFTGLSWEMFFKGVRMFYEDKDIWVGLTKSVVFGYLIGTFACFFGYYATNGAEGVGQGTKASVVASMTFILISAFLVSKILL
jgi:phospholipid/cholesterol/gamma-HCH transport system permease protein